MEDLLMRNRTGWGQWFGVSLGGAALAFASGAAALSTASQPAVNGRLTDQRGAALPGATILVFPSTTAEGTGGCRPDEWTSPGGPLGTTSSGGGTPICALLRTDADGAFTALLPPGRYLVAAIKEGYGVSITEVHSLASRVLRLRLDPTRAESTRRKPGPGEGIEWLLREEKDDILRRDDPGLPPAYDVVETRRSRAASAADALGSLDGDFTQSLAAGDLPGLASESSGDSGRATSLAARAPANERLAWSFAAGTARTQAPLTESGETIAGGADRLLAGAEYSGSAVSRLRGAMRVGLGRTQGGSAEVHDRLVSAEGTLATIDGGDPIVLAVRAWGAEAELGDGAYLDLDGTSSRTPAEDLSGTGLGLYAGSRHGFGAATTLRYGVEYHGDSMGGGARALPRVGVSHAVAGGTGLAVDGELLIDPAHPGGRLSLESRAGEGTLFAATVAVLPEFATASPEGLETSSPYGAASPAALSGGRRTVDLSVARAFGPLHGTLGGSLGRTTRRSLPVIDDGPMPIVSMGPERYYETRLGVAWIPSTTEMQVGYRRVEAEDAGDESAGQYRRLDLVVSQALPSPRGLDGARLRALVAWQAVVFDALLAGAGETIAGETSRLSGGVGLSF
jgi:hypothetical protein